MSASYASFKYGIYVFYLASRKCTSSICMVLFVIIALFLQSCYHDFNSFFSIVPQCCPSHLGAFSRKRSLSETISFFEDIVSSVAVIFALQVKEPNYRIISFNDRVFFMNFTIDLITLLVQNASVVVQFWAPWFYNMNLYSPKNYVIGSKRKISFS